MIAPRDNCLQIEIFLSFTIVTFDEGRGQTKYSLGSSESCYQLHTCDFSLFSDVIQNAFLNFFTQSQY